jgi:hypothetical protein
MDCNKTTSDEYIFPVVNCSVPKVPWRYLNVRTYLGLVAAPNWMFNSKHMSIFIELPMMFKLGHTILN